MNKGDVILSDADQPFVLLSPKRELLAKVLFLIACCLLIQLLLFKYLPDIGTATYQHGVSQLVSFEAFHSYYMKPDSVHNARFLGNYILYYVARSLDGVFHSTDIRLHPLRIAAAILTPIYFVIGALPIFFKQLSMNWRTFLTGYLTLFVGGMYVFYPCDAPSLAFLSIGLALLLTGNLVGAYLCLITIGLFRESALHLVALTAMWALCVNSRPVINRWSWTALFAVTFLVEYKVIRIFFPGPVASTGGITFDLHEIFLGGGLMSLTNIVTIALAAIYPLSYFVCQRNTVAPALAHFFRLNCYVIPIWLVFYRTLNGNISEFRMLWPVLLPCVFGIAVMSNWKSELNPFEGRAI